MPPKTATVTDQYQLGLASLQQGELDAAKQHFLAVLQEDPQHADALHSLGNIDARAQRFPDAERLMRRAIAINPMQALYFNSLGNVLRACSRHEEAAAVYRQALNLQPDLALVYNNLGALALEGGEPQEAAESCLKALELDPNFAGAYSNLGRALNNLGKLDEAADAFRRALLLRPRMAVAHNYLGHVQRAQGKLDAARASFAAALEIDPELMAAQRNLGTVHMALGETAEAANCFAEAVRVDPRDASGHIQLGIARHTIGRLGLAASSYRAALGIEPDNAEARLNLGIVLNELRQPGQAETELKRALEIEPGRVAAWAELAALYEDMSRIDDMREAVERALAIAPQDPRVNLEAARCDRRSGRFDEALARLHRIELAGLPARLAQQVHYELGLLHDRRDEVDEAYGHFVEANRYGLRNDRLKGVSASRFLRRIDALHECFTAARLSDWAKAPPQPAAETPVFLLGFPRSGTTLTDLLLDGHPGIRTLEEKPTVNKVIDAIRRNFDGGYPAALPRLGAADIESLREVYFSEVDRHVEREPGVVIVDKMPIRTVQAGLIWRLFPQSRFVFSLRHPCDVCLSGFMQQYNSNDAFANFFTLEDTVNVYDRVMSLWRLYVSRLRLDCHVVRYERLVADLEAEMRRLIRFLGLPWDDAAMDHTRRARERGRIWTNSYHQVSEPVYRRACDRWRRYRKYFEPHLERLAPHARYFGYTLDDESAARN